MALLGKLGDAMASPVGALKRARKLIEQGKRAEAFALLARAGMSRPVDSSMIFTS